MSKIKYRCCQFTTLMIGSQVTTLSRDTSTVTMDDLLGSLLTHEINLNRKESIELKMKSLAFKAKEEDESETSDEDEDLIYSQKALINS